VADETSHNGTGIFPIGEKRSREKLADNDSDNYLRNIRSDLTKSFYAIGCLAVDIFLLLQFYVWFPSPNTAVILFASLVLMSIFELWLYRALSLRFQRHKSKGSEFTLQF
jgi:hypothetical protein